MNCVNSPVYQIISYTVFHFMKLPTESYQAIIHINKNQSSSLTTSYLSAALPSNPSVNSYDLHRYYYSITLIINEERSVLN